MNFIVEFTTHAIKDLKKLPKSVQKQILKEYLRLETKPFQFKNKIKKIRGNKEFIYVLRIISKKDTDNIIQRIRHIDFPPE